MIVKLFRKYSLDSANSSHYIGAQSIEDEESQSHSADSVDIPPSVRDIRESSTGLELRTHTHHTTEASMRYLKSAVLKGN